MPMWGVNSPKVSFPIHHFYLYIFMNRTDRNSHFHNKYVRLWIKILCKRFVSWCTALSSWNFNEKNNKRFRRIPRHCAGKLVHSQHHTEPYWRQELLQVFQETSKKVSWVLGRWRSVSVRLVVDAECSGVCDTLILKQGRVGTCLRTVVPKLWVVAF